MTLIHDLDEREYHGDETSLSASGAKVLLGKRPPSGESESLSLGTLVHTVVLEPHKLDRYAVLDAHAIAGDNPKTGQPYDAPQMTARFKAEKKRVEESGKTVVAQEMWDKAHAMAAAVSGHEEAARLLHAATDVEVSAYADHPTGARVRARYDLLGPGFIADLKTTRDADPATFGKSAHAFGYHISAANYIDIARANDLEVDRFPLICVENEPNLAGQYRVSVLEMTDRAIDLGRDRMAEACQRWLDLGRRLELPDYGHDVRVIDLPPWAYYGTPAATTIPADFEWSLDEYA